MNWRAMPFQNSQCTSFVTERSRGFYPPCPRWPHAFWTVVGFLLKRVQPFCHSTSLPAGLSRCRKKCLPAYAYSCPRSPLPGWSALLRVYRAWTACRVCGERCAWGRDATQRATGKVGEIGRPSVHTDRSWQTKISKRGGRRFPLFNRFSDSD